MATQKTRNTATRTIARGRIQRKGRGKAWAKTRSNTRPWDTGWRETTIRFEEDQFQDILAYALEQKPKRTSYGEAVRVLVDIGLETLKQEKKRQQDEAKGNRSRLRTV